jgi:hypothetical protein
MKPGANRSDQKIRRDVVSMLADNQGRELGVGVWDWAIGRQMMLLEEPLGIASG